MTAQKPRLKELIFGGGTPKKAFYTALVVGTILTMINHGDLLVNGQFPSAIKVILTYITPFCVTTWGAATGKLAAHRAQLAGMEYMA